MPGTFPRGRRLCWCCGCTDAEVAAVMTTSLHTVRNQARLARAKVTPPDVAESRGTAVAWVWLHRECCVAVQWGQVSGNEQQMAPVVARSHERRPSDPGDARTREASARRSPRKKAALRRGFAVVAPALGLIAPTAPDSRPSSRPSYTTTWDVTCDRLALSSHSLPKGPMEASPRHRESKWRDAEATTSMPSPPPGPSRRIPQKQRSNSCSSGFATVSKRAAFLDPTRWAFIMATFAILSFLSRPTKCRPTSSAQEPSRSPLDS